MRLYIQLQEWTLEVTGRALKPESQYSVSYKEKIVK